VRLLLDTHALLWWLADHSSLSSAARRSIRTPANTPLVSAASAWEIGTKVRLGKLAGAESLVADFPGMLAAEHFEELPISIEHSIRASMLPGPHKDPFDRMLAAQCQAENLPIVSADPVFEQFGIRRIW